MTQTLDSLMYSMPQSSLEGRCAEDLLTSSREFLTTFFPLTKDEVEFIELLRNKGRIEPALLTSNEEIASKMKQDPALLFRASKAGK